MNLKLKVLLFFLAYLSFSIMAFYFIFIGLGNPQIVSSWKFLIGLIAYLYAYDFVKGIFGAIKEIVSNSKFKDN